MRFYAVGSSEAAPLDWRKSTFSWANGDCVQVASRSRGVVRVRDTKDPRGPMLAFDRGQWNAFVGAVRTNGVGDPGNT
jgi:hypothetical protein